MGSAPQSQATNDVIVKQEVEVINKPVEIQEEVKLKHQTLPVLTQSSNYTSEDNKGMKQKIKRTKQMPSQKQFKTIDTSADMQSGQVNKKPKNKQAFQVENLEDVPDEPPVITHTYRKKVRPASMLDM